MQWLLLAAGGAFGTLARYGVSRLGTRILGEHWFPFGTFAANLLGSFLLGVVVVVLADRSWLGVDLRLVVGTGVMGGFTTYSSFNLEALQLASEDTVRGLLYIGLTLALCLGAGWLGLVVGRGFAPS